MSKSDFLKYIDADKRESYKNVLEGPTPAFRIPQDIELDNIENLRVDPEHTNLKNRNYAIDLFGTPEDYEAVKSRLIPGRKVEYVIMDTGVPDHKDLVSSKSNYQIFYPGENFPDKNGHATGVGSYVASINPQTCPLHFLCGEGGVISASYVGVLSRFGGGSFTLIAQSCENLLTRVKRNTSLGILTILNLSLGASGSTPKRLGKALQKLKDAGAIIVGASGNDGRPVVSTPANHGSTEATSSVGPDLLLAGYSNYGKEVAQTAPGTLIYSAAPGNRYTSLTGTSMATPNSTIPMAVAWLTNPDLTNGQDVLDFIYPKFKDLGDPGKDIKYGTGIGVIKSILNGDQPDDPPIRKLRPYSFTTILPMSLLIDWKTSDGEGFGQIKITEVIASIRADRSIEAELKALLNKLPSQLAVTAPNKTGAAHIIKYISLHLNRLLDITVNELEASVAGHRLLEKRPVRMSKFYHPKDDGKSVEYTTIKGQEILLIH